jgi:hypothetical protein
VSRESIRSRTGCAVARRDETASASSDIGHPRRTVQELLGSSRP